MSPQSRHGKGSANRRARRHGDSGHRPESVVEPIADDEVVHSSSEPVEGKRAKVPGRRRKQHGLVYRWVAAYMPLLAVLFALLGALLVYTTFFKPPTPAERWVQIQNKWTPAREKARQDLVDDSLDFVKQLQDYEAFYTATKGWVDDVTGFDRWGQGDTTSEVSTDVSNFLSDSKNYLSLLQRAYTAKTPEDINAMQQTLPAADNTWETDVALIRVALGLPAVATTPQPLPLPSVNPTCIPLPSGSALASDSPSPSASPSPSGSPLASGSAGASASPEPTPFYCPATTPSPSAGSSGSPATSPSVSPAPSASATST